MLFILVTQTVCTYVCIYVCMQLGLNVKIKRDWKTEPIWKELQNPLIKPSKVNTGQMSEELILALIKSQTSLIFVSPNHEQLPGTP